ncbi:hypothetical protein AAEU32_11570 [Pseudoalteromonas sp. SSDWG2]|uniref:hypothetical protein n=1 Tax=Pseudoalteromonas sp. SSDWG2 TaxID=3139391 RepID=UPI003BABC1C8
MDKDMNKAQRLKEIEKEFIKLGIIDAIPMMMIGLGLYAKFSGVEEPFLPFLKDESIVNGMFLVAVPVVVWVMYKSLKLSLERARLAKGE